MGVLLLSVSTELLVSLHCDEMFLSPSSYLLPVFSFPFIATYLLQDLDFCPTWVFTICSLLAAS